MKLEHLSLNKRIVIIYLLTFAVVSLIPSVVLMIDPTLAEIDSPASVTFFSLTNFFWYLTVTILMILAAKTFLFKKEWPRFRKRLYQSLGVVVLAIALMFIANMLINGILMLGGVEGDPENQAMLERLSAGAWYDVGSLIFFAALFAPFVEEMLFRKVLYGFIRRHWGVVAAILLNSLAFASIHVVTELTAIAEDPGALLMVLPYFSLGVVISFVYYFSNHRIFVAIGAHMLWNILQLMFMFGGM